MQSLSDDRFHYIHNGDGSEELYARESDAAEAHNLVGGADSAAVLRRFRAELKRLLDGS
jgi:hypothetical protein